MTSVNQKYNTIQKQKQTLDFGKLENRPIGSELLRLSCTVKSRLYVPSPGNRPISLVAEKSFRL